jgi:hypothetical protein
MGWRGVEGGAVGAIMALQFGLPCYHALFLFEILDDQSCRLAMPQSCDTR